MTIDVDILDGPLPPAGSPGDSSPADPRRCAGARVCFEGIVRALENGCDLIALDYQAYEPMARNQLRELADEVLSRHGLLGVHVRHSRGRVPVGAVSFRLVILGAHRQESLAAMDEFIDRMKKDVPIWKTPVFA